MAYSDKERDIIFENVLTQISEEGLALRNILMQKGMPSSQTFYKWLEDQDKSKQYREITKTDIYVKNIRCKGNKKGSKASSINDYRLVNARNVNKKRFPVSNIYIFKIDKLKLYKIGVSQNVDRRFRDIYNSMPFDLEIEFTKKVKDAYLLESKLHKQFETKSIKNEWFLLKKSDLDKIIKICQDQ